jgi:nitrogen fixation/metabolism regulation signal transduction histidine kinase
MSRRSTRWALLVAGIATTGVVLVLVFLLSLATNNRVFYERHYNWLFWVNVSVAALLGLVIVIAAARLGIRLWRGKFGSRLLFKLAGIFALVGVLPGALIYTVSYQFVSRSIESWFDVQVEGALDAGLNLGRTSLQTLVKDLQGRTRIAAERLSESPDRQQTLALERLREQLSAQSVRVLGPSGQVLVAVGDPGGTGLFGAERPGGAMLRQVRQQRSVAVLEGLDDDAPAGAPPFSTLTPRVRAMAWIPSSDFSLQSEDRYLQVVQAVPASLAADALSVQAAYREYQQRSLARDGLRKMYIGTLTLTLILAVFSAVLMAAALGHQLARPLLVLADGVRQVARGDLRPTEVFASRDELGGLTRSFAEMTQQLADARALVQRSLAEVESAKVQLQTILDNLTAGVILFDGGLRIDTVNPGATRILRAPLSACRGRTLAEVPSLEPLGTWVAERFRTLQAEPEEGERDLWQESFDLVLGEADSARTLLVRGVLLPEGERLIVFDDISEVVSAQRSVAWSEVARRLAHEIKNPLTPIQLSAERLQHKLEAKLVEEKDQQMLARSVGTIVNQVQAMKQLVNEFRDYARLPSAQITDLDLNALVTEVLGLYAHQQEAGRLSAEPAPGLPAIRGDASQLRQVIHNLVQNALDAVQERAGGHVTVRTEAALNDDGSVRAVRLKVIDNGPGFPEKVLKRAFEPYVTTKARGTGLGLAVVKKIADEHGARIRVTNVVPDGGVSGPGQAAAVGGAQVSLSFLDLSLPNAGAMSRTAVTAAGPVPPAEPGVS